MRSIPKIHHFYWISNTLQHNRLKKDSMEIFDRFSNGNVIHGIHRPAIGISTAIFYIHLYIIEVLTVELAISSP